MKTKIATGKAPNQQPGDTIEKAQVKPLAPFQA